MKLNYDKIYRLVFHWSVCKKQTSPCKWVRDNSLQSHCFLTLVSLHFTLPRFSFGLTRSYEKKGLLDFFFPWSVLQDIFFLYFCCAGFFFGNFPTPPSKIKWFIPKENQNNLLGVHRVFLKISSGSPLNAWWWKADSILRNE